MPTCYPWEPYYFGGKKGNLIRESVTRNLIAREPNSLSPTQGDETELGLLDIAYVGRVIPMQAQICFRASHACHELGSLCSELRSELLSCKLRTAGNTRRVSQPTVFFDYRPQNHEEPGLELASEYSPRLRRNLIRSGHSEHQSR